MITNINDYNSAMVNFKRLRAQNWHAIGDVDIDLSAKVTVLTGANGSGKTSILRLLAMHASWAAVDYNVPSRLADEPPEQPNDANPHKAIGVIEYSDNHSTNILCSTGGLHRHIGLSEGRSLHCIFVSAHRPPFRYEAIKVGIQVDEGSDPLKAIDLARSGQKAAVEGTTNNFGVSIKRTLFAWLVAGYGVMTDGKYLLRPSSEIKEYFEGFQNVLRLVIPDEFKFESIEVDVGGEIVLLCDAGRTRFLIESASGGLAAVIEIAWMLYLQQIGAGRGREFTAIIDELENHLHPSIQRSILPKLVKAFPSARFVISTHSPLIVSSMSNANVYALRFDERSRVYAELLDFKEKARTAAQILDEVLGVSVTLPVWVEEKLTRIVKDFSQRPFNESLFSDLRNTLEAHGLDDFFPEALTAVIK